MSTPAEYEHALVGAARRALSQYAPEAAALTHGRDSATGIWSFDITPTDQRCAAVSCAYVGDDEVTLTFGCTHVYVWDDDPAELSRIVQRYLDAVLAGRFVEAGSRDDAFARLTDETGAHWTAGRVALPLPWRWRRTRTYAAYESPRSS
jgi:hypothetical protein